MRRMIFGTVIALGFAVQADAIVIDGTRDAEYGPAVAVQTVQTQFGDNQSEWNAAYAKIEGGRLNLLLTGNLENNFNKLEIFIDSRAGGENTLSGTPGNDGTGVMAGMTFDTAFAPDFHLIARRGAGKFDLDFAELGTASNFTFYEDILDGGDSGVGSTGTGANASAIDVAYDGSNIAGIAGGTGAADQAAALAVTTGLELSIALSDLGNPAGPFKVSVMQNGSGHDFMSNQMLGGLPAGTGNLGGDGGGSFTGDLAGIDLNQFPGDQFFIVPEPGSLALLGLGGLLAVNRRRTRHEAA